MNREQINLRNSERINCHICNKELRKDSLTKHIKKIHNEIVYILRK